MTDNRKSQAFRKIRTGQTSTKTYPRINKNRIRTIAEPIHRAEARVAGFRFNERRPIAPERIANTNPTYSRRSNLARQQVVGESKVGHDLKELMIVERDLLGPYPCYVDDPRCDRQPGQGPRCLSEILRPPVRKCARGKGDEGEKRRSKRMEQRTEKKSQARETISAIKAEKNGKKAKGRDRASGTSDWVVRVAAAPTMS